MVEKKYLVNNKISSQYFVIYPLLQCTEGQTFSDTSSNKVFHTLCGILAHSSMQISSRAVMFWDFNSLQRFSMGLRSGDWLGHSRTLEMLLTKPTPSLPGAVSCVWDHCHAERPSTFIFNALLMEGGFHSKSHDTWPQFILSFTQISRSWSLCRKNSPKAWCFHPHASQ